MPSKLEKSKIEDIKILVFFASSVHVILYTVLKTTNVINLLHDDKQTKKKVPTTNYNYKTTREAKMEG
jgi:hypothetical protein